MDGSTTPTSCISKAAFADLEMSFSTATGQGARWPQTSCLLPDKHVKTNRKEKKENAEVMNLVFSVLSRDFSLCEIKSRPE